MSVPLELLGFAAALTCNALFEGAESVIISVNRHDMREREERGDQSAARSLKLVGNTTSVLFATQLGTITCLVVATMLALSVFMQLTSPATHPAAVALWTTLIVLPPMALITVFLAKALGRKLADRIIGAITLPLSIWQTLTSPIGNVVGWFAQGAVAALRINVISSPWPLSREALLQAVEDEDGQEHLDLDEREMIQRIFDLDETTVREVMRPLIRLVTIKETELTQERVASLARSTGFTRFPVQRERIIDLIGYVDINEVLQGGDKSPTEMRALINRPHYVPESKSVDDLLQEFLRDRLRVAIVIDEHGSCSGWVTLEDILEEIFGEMADEFDGDERPPWEVDAQGRVTFEAEIHLDEIRDHFGLAIPAEHCDTLGGFIYEALGRVPWIGEKVAISGGVFRVVAMKSPRIERVRWEPGVTNAQ